MAVSTIALYASPPSSVCSGPLPIASHSSSYDFLDVNGRSTGASPSSSAVASSKPSIGGLSCLFSSSPPTIKSSNYPDEFKSLRSDEHSLGSSSRHSSSFKRESQVNQSSPLSVLHGFGGSSIGSGCSRVSGDFNSARLKFVTHALGTISVGYDTDSSACAGASGILENELTFDMEGSDVEDVDLPPYARDMLIDAQSRHGVFNDHVVVRAFCVAEKAHRGQNRASGHPYLQHCVETGALLASIGANSMVVAAGLLHDTLDDCSVSYGDIHGSFGSSVADLVEGVSKLSHLSKLARENNTACKTDEADRLHTMFLAMTDARAVLIKLADRLHNMMTLSALPLIKQQRIAKETLEIFVPLANRLGISTWKEQLENLCFMYLYPDYHRELSARLVNSFDEALITSSLEKLELALKDAGVSYNSASGRHKSLYSIYSKMSKKKLSMDEIHDIHGLRLIVDKEEDCYKALTVVRQIWNEVPGRFKDYIKHPKFNGYQSLHIVVSGEGMVPLEVQIRTKEMHLQAEYGFAAHWRYKEGADCKLHSSFVLQMVEWARWVISWQCEAMSKDKSSPYLLDCTFPQHSKDCTFSHTPHHLHDEPVFVIMIENDKMSVKEVQADSTMSDLLEKAGRGCSRWGNSYGFATKEELRPRLNHKPVSDITCRLKMGDVVELTPTISDKSLTEYREEIQRMYDRGLAVSSSTGRLASSKYS